MEYIFYKIREYYKIRDYFSALKEEEILPFEKTWMKQGGIMPSERFFFWQRNYKRF